MLKALGRCNRQKWVSHLGETRQPAANLRTAPILTTTRTQGAWSTYSSDSALFSLSQRQQSQNDFSQVRTQDLFTQNHTSGSQSESSFPASRKMSMYDKWMSKGSMFRKEQTKTAGSACPLPGQQQYQFNTVMNKTKGTDERDLMQQVVNIVQDCNKEVKNTLTAVRETLETRSEFSGEKLNDTMKAFLEDVWKHGERMLQAIEEGKQSKEKSHELEKQLAAKEAVIKQLQGQLEERDKAGDVKQVARAVRQEMLSPHLAVENKLMEILEVTREVSEQHSDQLTQYHSQLTAQAKDHKEWKTANHKLLKDMEKRLQKDMGNLRKELQKDEEEWRHCVQDQLTEACSSHSQDMERLIEKAITDCTATVTTRQGTNTAAVTSAVVTAVKKELQALLQRQSKSTEKSVQTLWQHQAHKQQQQLQSLHHSILAVVTEGLQSVTQQVHEKDRDDVDMPLTMPAFEEKIEEYHADIKQQLEEMHRHHVEEVRRLQNDAALTDHAVASSSAHRPFTNTMAVTAQSVTSNQVGFPKATGYPLQRRKEMAKISPLSKQDRASLFSRPSPVVAVLPQQQSVQPSSVFTDNLRMDSDMDVTFKQQPSPTADLCTKVEASKKRKTTKGRKKKKAAKKGKVVKKVQVIQNENSCHQPRTTTTSQQLTVYDFSDQHSPDQGRPLFKSFQLQNCDNQRSELCSPSASTESCLSSPAMSITVDTEMVWVRRSRWQTSSAQRQSRTTVNMMNDAVLGDQTDKDMLSSPFMSSITTHTTVPQLELEKDHVKLSRTRSGRKRLC